jgi:hypothetical protein
MGPAPGGMRERSSSLLALQAEDQRHAIEQAMFHDGQAYQTQEGGERIPSPVLVASGQKP